jgi:alginate O-acetyltransferase complex protein AlgI
VIFASFVFLFGFLPLFLACYYALPRGTARNLFLTLASYLFYGWWRPDFVLLMAFSTLVDYGCARAMGSADERRARRPWLWVSVVTNLGLLGWFKYANLAVAALGDLRGSGIEGWTAVVLPVGISFYTFQSMSYTIDVYRGEVRPVHSLIDLACYVSMFPQLVAGPIVRYRDVQRQVRQRVENLDMFARGVAMFAIGFAKKVLIADNAALLAEPVFAAKVNGLVDSWIGVGAYAVQIYYDFSGYSDMAIGLGMLIGFRFPRNFDSPYKSESITEFWRRWHISLSTWLRDYLYVPLGGNRRGEVRTYANLATTMLLGGLWHGAAYNFVIWGAYQGLFLVFERLTGKAPVYARLWRPLRVGITFAIVLGGWAVFNVKDMAGLGRIWGGMLGLGGLGAWPAAASHPAEAWIAVLVGLALAFGAPTTERLCRRLGARTAVFACAVLFVALGQLATRDYSPFIYFQF